MRGMRAVSFLSTEEGKFGAELTDAAGGEGTGIETGGDFAGETDEGGGDWKNWRVLKQATALLEPGEVQCRMADEPAAGFAQSRAILYLDWGGLLQAAAAGAAIQCERSLFLVRRPFGGISIGNLARKTGPCHLLTAFSPKNIFLCNRGVSGEQIVSAASSNSAPNEIANRRRFG